MKTRSGTLHRQRGVTAVLAAITVVVLVGILGWVIDLGVLYVRKTELQNAADAAALAGARELDGTGDGIVNSAREAIATAALNGVDFAANPVAIDNGNLSFGPTSDGPWVNYTDAQAAPKNKWFIRVVTDSETRQTWFIHVLAEAMSETTASALAVAGRTLCEGIPIFTCVDPAEVISGDECATPNCGFTPGKSYRLTAKEGANTTIGPGNIGWLDPVPPGEPGEIIGTDDLRKRLCRGVTRCLDAPTTYTSLTQNAFHPTADALNTRFGIFQGALNKPEYKEDNPEANTLACRVDTNIKEYRFNDIDWQAPSPSAQTDEEAPIDEYGVWWAAVRPSDTAVPAMVEGEYPDKGTPYGQSGNNDWSQTYSGTVPQEAGRRILSIGLASNCGSIIGSGKPVRIVAYARFLLQRLAFETGSEKGFYGEFIEVVPSGPVLRPSIKLYH